MTTTIDSTQAETAPTTDPYGRVLDNLDANFGVAPRRRAAHAKGVVVTGFFSPTAEASEITRAGHLTGARTPVVARFSSFPGGADHPDTAPEANPRGLAVQFRLSNGATTDLLAHSINGFPGRTIEDFGDFLGAIAPGGPGPEDYLATHPAAAAFVHAIQSHGVPASFATLSYRPVNAFRFQAPDGTENVGRYVWVPVAGQKVLDDEGAASKGPDFLAEELAARLAAGPVSFVLELQVAEPGDVDRRRQCPVAVGSAPCRARDAAPDRSGAGQRVRRTGPLLRPGPARRRDYPLRRPAARRPHPYLPAVVGPSTHRRVIDPPPTAPGRSHDARQRRGGRRDRRRDPLVRPARSPRVVPGIVIEILAGLALGPHGLGWITIDPAVDTLALLGLAFLFFLAGLEIDLSTIRGWLLARSLTAYALSVLLAGVIATVLHLLGVLDDPPWWRWRSPRPDWGWWSRSCAMPACCGPRTAKLSPLPPASLSSPRW